MILRARPPVASVISFIDCINRREVERGLTVIWVAEVAQGRLRHWELVADSEDSRRQLGLDRV
ncbi:MAG: hypothetical protein E6G27_00850 [Actinobacteria bacterium]|nr:MAG: hypothetical protein E6G27_00850 [Actinomycetota bacterium]